MPYAQAGKKACCDGCANGGTCSGGLGDADDFENAMWTALVIAAWIAFNELGKMQKGKKSFFDRWK